MDLVALSYETDASYVHIQPHIDHTLIKSYMGMTRHKNRNQQLKPTISMIPSTRQMDTRFSRGYGRSTTRGYWKIPGVSHIEPPEVDINIDNIIYYSQIILEREREKERHYYTY